MLTDYSTLILQTYFSGKAHHELTKTHIKAAADTINRLYPPATASEVFALLAALNLLNAAVKTTWGSAIVGYGYIKGVAGLLFEHLTVSPVAGVQIYNDRQECVTYFRVMGVQISFHYVPISQNVPQGRPTQHWDGIRLQYIAVEVFNLACSLLPDLQQRPVRSILSIDIHKPANLPAPAQTGLSKSAKRRAKKRAQGQAQMCRKARWWLYRLSENYQKSLEVALHFSIWRSDSFTLMRRKDHQLIPVVRFNGDNYTSLVSTLIWSHSPIPKRTAEELFCGFLYFISPKKRLRAILPSTYVRLLTQNNYVCGKKRQLYNLLVSYGIARYLTKCFPQIRVACTLITNRRTIKNRLFNNTMLRRIPLNSRMRRLKVWLIIDPTDALRQFHVTDLPPVLLKEYQQAEDYYQEFEITCHKGRKGIYAYRRHHLLKPVWKDIEIYHYYAYVQRDDDMWAIYALQKESFVSNFIYTRIRYDKEQYIIFGEVDGQPTVIHDFFNPNSRDFY